MSTKFLAGHFRPLLRVNWILYFLGIFCNDATAQYMSAYTQCPIACGPNARDPSTWTYYHDFDALTNCNASVLMELNIHNSISNPDTHLAFRACTSSKSTSSSGDHAGEIAKRQKLSLNTTSPSQVPLYMATWGRDGAFTDLQSISSAIHALDTAIENSGSWGNSMFAKDHNTFVGLYIGAEVQSNSAARVLQSFLSHLDSSSAQRQAVQACGSGNQTSDPHFFGIIYDTTGDAAAVQEAVESWSDAKCVEGAPSNSVWQGVSLELESGSDISIVPQHDQSITRDLLPRALAQRDTCSYIQAQSGDGCYSLAQRCGISMDQLESYNGGDSFCNSIQVGQYVCCSAGDPPNFAPQPSNGNCYSYTVQSGDTCSTIATSHQMQVSGIENNNGQVCRP